jgi:hypothetical protein
MAVNSLVTHPNTRLLVPAYVATMLLSAALLFLVQPMFARMALPLLGGTPAVWAIAMCFFQAVLLGGYCYAHLLKKFVPPLFAVPLHVGLMALAWFSLPVNLPMADVPAGGASAGLWLIGLMAKAIGYPFFFISATAPLLQSWFARTAHKDAANPYFLYSASNIGSLGALVAYPFVVEPLLGLHNQALLWSFGFMGLAIAIGLCGLMMLKGRAVVENSVSTLSVTAITWKDRGWWIFLSFVPSALLVAWTNHITTDIASAPFLWLPPLVLFLLTFVLVFRDRPLISLKLMRIMQLVSLPIAFVVQFALPLSFAVPVMIIGALSFFSTAIICHRQLYETRPDASHLTEFYMLMSVGGVLGGLFVSLIAPLVFNSVFEYPLLLVIGVAARQDVFHNSKIISVLKQPLLPIAICIGLMLLTALTAPQGGFHLLISTRVIEAGLFGAFAFIAFRAQHMAVAVLSMVMVVLSSLTGQTPERVAMRSYFGVLSVTDNSGYRLLNHGTTVHGAQRLDELREGFAGKPHPLTYYSPEGGMARALLTTQARLAAEGQNGIIRVIGLGTGSLACYAKPNEDWAYYEIDRDVIKVAQDKNQFTFLSACAPNMKMIEGDARITLNQSKDEKADYLLVDAFSSDSIPVHLITTEAMQLYLSHIKDDGMLVIHVTNRYMDLVPVVAANMHAVDPGLQGRVIDYVPPKAGDLNAAHSIAIAISKSSKNLEALDQNNDVKPLVPVAGIDQWTDDFSNLPGAIIRRLSVTKY